MSQILAYINENNVIYPTSVIGQNSQLITRKHLKAILVDMTLPDENNPQNYNFSYFRRFMSTMGLPNKLARIISLGPEILFPRIGSVMQIRQLFRILSQNDSVINYSKICNFFSMFFHALTLMSVENTNYLEKTRKSCHILALEMVDSIFKEVSPKYSGVISYIEFFEWITARSLTDLEDSNIDIHISLQTLFKETKFHFFYTDHLYDVLVSYSDEFGCLSKAIFYEAIYWMHCMYSTSSTTATDDIVNDIDNLYSIHKDSHEYVNRKYLRSFLSQIYELFDHEKNDQVCVAELACGLSILCCDREDNKYSVCQFFDSDQDGFLSTEEVYHFFHCSFRVLYYLKDMTEQFITVDELAHQCTTQAFDEAILSYATQERDFISIDCLVRWCIGSSLARLSYGINRHSSTPSVASEGDCDIYTDGQETEIRTAKKVRDMEVESNNTEEEVAEASGQLVLSIPQIFTLMDLEGDGVLDAEEMRIFLTEVYTNLYVPTSTTTVDNNKTTTANTAIKLSMGNDKSSLLESAQAMARATTHSCFSVTSKDSVNSFDALTLSDFEDWCLKPSSVRLFNSMIHAITHYCSDRYHNFTTECTSTPSITAITGLINELRSMTTYAPNLLENLDELMFSLDDSGVISRKAFSNLVLELCLGNSMSGPSTSSESHTKEWFRNRLAQLSDMMFSLLHIYRSTSYNVGAPTSSPTTIAASPTVGYIDTYLVRRCISLLCIPNKDISSEDRAVGMASGSAKRITSTPLQATYIHSVLTKKEDATEKEAREGSLVGESDADEGGKPLACPPGYDGKVFRSLPTSVQQDIVLIASLKPEDEQDVPGSGSTSSRPLILTSSEVQRSHWTDRPHNPTPPLDEVLRIVGLPDLRLLLGLKYVTAKEVTSHLLQATSPAGTIERLAFQKVLRQFMFIGSQEAGVLTPQQRSSAVLLTDTLFDILSRFPHASTSTSTGPAGSTTALRYRDVLCCLSTLCNDESAEDVARLTYNSFLGLSSQDMLKESLVKCLTACLSMIVHSVPDTTLSQWLSLPILSPTRIDVARNTRVLELAELLATDVLSYKQSTRQASVSLTLFVEWFGKTLDIKKLLKLDEIHHKIVEWRPTKRAAYDESLPVSASSSVFENYENSEEDEEVNETAGALSVDIDGDNESGAESFGHSDDGEGDEDHSSDNKVMSDLRVAARTLGLTGVTAEDFLESLGEYSKNGYTTLRGWVALVGNLVRLEGGGEGDVFQAETFATHIFQKLSVVNDENSVHGDRLLFEDFVSSLTVLCNGPVEDRIMVAFTQLDKTGTKSISVEAFERLVKNILLIVSCCSEVAGQLIDELNVNVCTLSKAALNKYLAMEGLSREDQVTFPDLMSFVETCVDTSKETNLSI